MKIVGVEVVLEGNIKRITIVNICHWCESAAKHQKKINLWHLNGFPIPSKVQKPLNCLFRVYVERRRVRLKSHSFETKTERYMSSLGVSFTDYLIGPLTSNFVARLDHQFCGDGPQIRGSNSWSIFSETYCDLSRDKIAIKIAAQFAQQSCWCEQSDMVYFGTSDRSHRYVRCYVVSWP